MDILDICTNNERSYYFPIAIMEKTVYLKEINYNFEIYPYLNSGIFRYNWIDHTLEKVVDSNLIVEVMSEPKSNTIYYIIANTHESYFIYELYSLNMYNNDIKKLFDFKVNRLKSLGDVACTKEDALDVFTTRRLQYFPIDDRYILVLIDNVNDCNTEYSFWRETNKYHLFCFDISENHMYQVVDNCIFEDGILEVEKINIGNKYYLLFNTGNIAYEDREEIYNEIKYNGISEDYRGIKSSIILVEMDDFINRIKINKKVLVYKEVDSREYNGFISYIGNKDTKINYYLSNYDKKFNEFICYDVEKDAYEIQQLNKNDKYEYDVYDKEIYVKEEFGDCYITTALICKKKVVYPKKFDMIYSILENKYLIAESYEEGEFWRNIYDLSNNSIIKKVTSRMAVFEENNIVVIY